MASNLDYDSNEEIYEIDNDDFELDDDFAELQKTVRAKRKSLNANQARPPKYKTNPGGSLSQSSKAEPASKPAVSSLKKNEFNFSLASKIDRLCEFAHVLMHCVLYKINYYNKKNHFEKYLKYNIVVYKCKSEIVCEYITNCVESMRLLLYKNYKLEKKLEACASKSRLEPSTFSIGLAVLKSSEGSETSRTLNENLLIKRYTLQIENGFNESGENSEDCVVSKENLNESVEENEPESALDEWNFRDSILKCLYAKETQFPANFKWQIQLRTNKARMKEMSNDEDLFKLFAWRQCEHEEVTSITTKASSSKSINSICVEPIKTMTHLNKTHKLRIQLYAESPQLVINKSRRKKLKKYRPSLNKTLNSSTSSSDGNLDASALDI